MYFTSLKSNCKWELFVLKESVTPVYIKNDKLFLTKNIDLKNLFTYQTLN